MMTVIIPIIIALLTLIGPVPPLWSVLSDIKNYIIVIDNNFVSKTSGKRILYKSTLKARQTVDPECVQMHADKKDKELMSQCSLLFNKQVDAWYINNFWYLKFFINIQLNKLDNKIKVELNKMQENAKKHPAIFLEQYNELKWNADKTIIVKDE